MRVAFSLLLFFGGPLALVIGLVHPQVFRGTRLRAVVVALAVSGAGLAGAVLTTSHAEWQSIGAQVEQDRVERAARAEAAAAQAASQREAAAVERERRMREQENREIEERRRREQDRAAAAQAERERPAREAREREEAARAAAVEREARETRARQPDRVRTRDLDSVFLWRDTAAMREAMRLYNANVQQTNPGLILRNVACVVPAGTAVVITDGGVFSSEVLVVEGDRSGCRGVVPNEDIERRR